MSSKGFYQRQESIAYNIANLEDVPIDQFIRNTEKFAHGTTPIFPSPVSIFHKRFYLKPLNIYNMQQQTKSIIKAEVIRKPKNKFSFINICTSQEEEIIDVDLTTETSFYEELINYQHHEETMYLRKFSNYFDFMKSDSKPSQKLMIEQLNGTPIYHLSFQRVSQSMMDKYEQVMR